jgi:hypothetical protein
VTWMPSRPPWKWMLATAALLLVAGAVGWVLAGDLGGSSAPDSELIVAPTEAPGATAKPTATARPTSTPAPPAPRPPCALADTAIGVDAPVSMKGPARRLMEVWAEDVAWYSSTRPGRSGCRHIGHLDYHDYGRRSSGGSRSCARRRRQCACRRLRAALPGSSGSPHADQAPVPRSSARQPRR